MPLRRSRAKKGRSTTTTTAAAATTRESPGRDNAGWCAPTVCVRIRPALECETSSRGVGSGDDDHGRGEWNGSGVSTAELSSSSVVLDTASSLGAGFEKASSSSVMQYAVGVEEDPAPPIPPPPPSSPAAPSFSRVLCESLTLPSRRRRSRSGKKKHGFASISGKDVVAVDERQSYLSPPPPPPSIPSSSPKSPSSHLRWVASKALKGGGARGGGAGGGGMENIEPSSPLQSPSSSLFRSVIAATEEGEGSTPTSTSTSASAWWYPDVDGRTVHCRGSTPASESSAPAAPPSYGPRPQHHVFDAVHPPASTNERLYASQVRPLVVSAVRDGYDAVVLAVGPRGGGKTRCLVGASKDDPGLLPLAILDLFAKAAEAESEAREVATASPRDSTKVPSPWKRHMSLGKGKKMIKKKGPKAVSPPRVGRKRHRVTMSCVRVGSGTVQDCLLPPSPSESNLGGTTPGGGRGGGTAAAPTTLDCSDSGEALATLHRALGRASYFASAEARHREQEEAREAPPFKDESDFAAGGIRVDNNGDGRSDAAGKAPRERRFASGGGSAVVVRFAIECAVTELDGDTHKARRRFVRTSALTFVDPSGWNDHSGGDADSGLREALEAAMADYSAKMSDLNSFRRLVLEESDKDDKTGTNRIDAELEPSSLEDYRLSRLLRPSSLLRSRVAIVCALAPPPAPLPMPTTPDVSPIPVSFFSSSAASEDSAERIKAAAAASASAIEALEFASRLRASLRLRPRPNPLRPELVPAPQSPSTPMETAEAQRYEAEIQSLRRQLAERRDEEAETKRRAALEEELERSRAEVERLRTEMNEIVTAPTSGSGRLHFLNGRGTPRADGSSHNDDSESNALVDKGNGDNDMEAALREQRLEDAVKHVDNAILRIARAHDIDLSPLLKMNTSGGGGNNLGAVLAATTAGGGAALPATEGSVVEEVKSGLFLDDGRRVDKKEDGENKDDVEDDDDESGWEGVGAMGALLEEDDAFSGSQSFGGSRGGEQPSWHSSSSFSSRRRLAVASAMSAGPGSSRASRGGGSSKRSGSSSSTAALMRRSADRARLRTAASSNSADGAAARASSASPSLIGREGGGGVGGIGEKEEESPIDFDEWEKRTFATAEEGSVSNWFGGDGGKGGGFGGDDDLDSWDEDDFHSIHSRAQCTDSSGFPTSPLPTSSPPHLLPPRESLLPSRRLRRSAGGSYKGEALLTARRRRREAEERLKFAFGRSAVKSQDDDDDDALSVVSDAVSSLTSATTLFGRGADRHGGGGDLAHRDPAVVVGELWRIQGLLRAAISKDHDGFPATSALERNSFRRQNGGTPRPGERWAK